MTARIDYDYIEKHVPQGARVLDLGCGDGTLLRELTERRGCTVLGIEIDEAEVRRCIERGVPVYHGDMLDGMSMFKDGSFDCVVLSQTLQQVIDPVRVVHEMLRVGRMAFVSFPNFGHWRVRLQLLLRGRAPVTATLPYQWYDTPNIRVLTVRDFVRFCQEHRVRIVDRIFFSPKMRRVPAPAANFMAASALFVIGKGP
jgi:methionine biosynthesis protein MetW